jgi:Tol biopolymer transport system component/predicted Ser/Thr protein kinase
MIGQTISHFHILEKLGEGGMGVVYRAEDTKLKRAVALKFLPRGLEAQEPERARFLQEAQAASALNHPNVCTIYEISEHEGQQFIVMEYVDGKTLRHIVPVQKTQTAIDYAIQIGEALQEAHGKGIVHRDIKTDNIMVNSKNQIKVMDFGLAKLKGSLKLTKISSTVGTLAYMAPEQIQGEQVNARSDIFSFGVVLYEMLTGHLPFRGEHEAAMMYSILNEEPESLQKHLLDAPPELVHVLDRVLEKDPGERYQTAHDMVIDLRRIRKRTSRVTRLAPAAQPVPPSLPEGSREPPETRLKRFRFRRGVWILLACAVVCFAAVVLFVMLPPRAVRLNPDMTFRVLPIPFTEVGLPGLSHDGNWAAYPASDANSKWDVYFMNTTSGESRRITSDSSVRMNNADISPDGSQIVYDRYSASTNQMGIAIVSSVGGSSKKVVDGGALPRWQPDGQRIGYVRGKRSASQSGKAEFWTIKPNGTDNRRELVDSVSREARGFSWSPDGRSICWIRYFSELCQEVIMYELSTGNAKQVTFDKKEITDVCWAPNDQIIFASNRSGNFNLWMVPASGGSATQITKGAGPDYSMVISSDGSKLLYYQEQYISHIWIAGTDGSNPHQITFDDAFLWRISFSPDGKEILFALYQKIGTKEEEFVCSIDRDGRNRKQLTSGEESINNPLPSPDGRWIIYGRCQLSEPVDSSRVYLIDAKNPGTPKLVGKGVPFRWIDEKTFISFDFAALSTWLNCIDVGKPGKFFEDSTFAIPLQGGKYIGYYDRRSGREGIWVSAAPGMKDPSLPSPRKLVSLFGINAVFDKSGKFFWYVKDAGELRRISIPSGKEEIIRGVFPGFRAFYYSNFEISYDGKEIVYTDARVNSKLIMIENVFK